MGEGSGLCNKRLKCDQILKCGTAVVVCNRYRWIKRLAR